MQLETFTLTVYILYVREQGMYKNCFTLVLYRRLKAVLWGFRRLAGEGRCWEFSSLPSFHLSSWQDSPVGNF